MGGMVCYLSVDWDWIKQRPHFMAEELAKYGPVTVCYRRQFHRRGLQSNAAANGVQLRPFYTLPPLRDRFRPLTWLNRQIARFRLGRLLKRERPDWLWLTYPAQILEVPKSYSGRIVYDCMDDQLKLACPRALTAVLPKAEAQLCRRADVIFVSSEALRETLRRRYGAAAEKAVLLRNGFQPAGRVSPPVAASPHPFRIGYIGTVSDWFDFSLVRASLDRFPNLEYDIVGPVRLADPPQHARLHYRGTIEHAKLVEFAATVDCLAMPFRDNEIVRAVDPVKLYEYLDFEKNVLCLDYPEVRRFAPYVQLYRDEADYLQKLGELMQDNRLRYSAAEARTFLAENTWPVRAAEAHRVLKAADEKKRETLQ